MTQDVDLLILGGGCAGLALGRELALRKVALTTAIIEPRQRYEEDRTWCFWRRSGSAPPVPLDKTWTRWRLSMGDQRAIHTGLGWEYALVRSGCYYDTAVRAIESAPSMTLHTACHAGVIRHTGRGAEVETSLGAIRASQVVDTRPPDRRRLERAPIAQVFSGREVETAEDRFDPGTALLMDQLRLEAGQLVFDYVLPLSSRRALIEHTVFSQHPVLPESLDRACMQLVQARAGPHARVLRSERGWLPMGLPAAPRRNGAVWNAGTSAGALRASSGYGFMRIQRWARQCAERISGGKSPLAQAGDPAFRRGMDHIFLKALSQDLSLAPSVFMAMSRALDGDAFARFMTDAASPLDWARAVAALPKRAFLKAALQPPRPHQQREAG